MPSSVPPTCLPTASASPTPLSMSQSAARGQGGGQQQGPGETTPFPLPRPRIQEHPVIACDLEGVKLSRYGQLCLAQFCYAGDPRTTWVVDVYSMGPRVFDVSSPNGTSLKSILADPAVLKVWFDPRNDVDALFHQFQVRVRSVFCLQLAEVAFRRSQNVPVKYVKGLFKMLNSSDALSPAEKAFAHKINEMGKNLFEPDNGGRYEVFQERPLNLVILVYAAHDVHFMLTLYKRAAEQLGPYWLQRILEHSAVRADWCDKPEYEVPSSEAPDM